MRTTVLIAEDNVLIREGYLEPLLASHYDIIASVDNGQDAVLAAAEHRPAVVLLDVSLPRLRGFEAARKIFAANPVCKILFVTNYEERAYVKAANEMGAFGYVLKARAPTELVPAIESAVKVSSTIRPSKPSPPELGERRKTRFHDGSEPGCF